MKSLLPHQEQAANSVLKEFQLADRAHIVMACGTGKTFTALKIAEKIQARSIIVFLPSLALINQFMREWLSEDLLVDLLTLCVCGDDTVTKDIGSESILCDEITFPVTTDPKEIQLFVERKIGSTKLIFCTYQSSNILIEACGEYVFDLAIFDEAHKTAGIDKKFSCSLDNNLISIRKRLFMTATPRHAHATIRDDDGAPAVIYSMDDESLYGRRVYTLGFREAINLGLICDYKIIISVANESDSIVRGNLHAGAIALEKAIESSVTKKIITYHGSIKKAKEFCTHIKNECRLKGFTISHINGEMSIRTRNKIMTSFRSSERSIICNSRCLTEGVDIPAVDMVAFLNPKSSTIDIVQAIGRALRKAPGKQRGYVFLPVFLDNSIKNESDTIQGSEFSHIWDVLNTLSEQDTDLNDVIKKIGKRRGEKWSDNENKANEYITIDERLDVSFLNSIQARIIEDVSYLWQAQYKKLVDYKERYGEIRVVPRGENKSLGLWVKKQRALNAKGILDKEKKLALDKLGFIWSVNESSWHEMYNKLVKFYNLNGHSRPSKSIKNEEETKLAKWCREQNRSFNHGTISKDKIDLLNKVEYPFKETQKRINWFDSMYPRMVKHLNAMGRKTFPPRGSSFGKSRTLRAFVHRARVAYKEKQLSKDQIKLLTKIRFVWQPDAGHKLRKHTQESI